jgi:hypothetical protein
MTTEEQIKAFGKNQIAKIAREKIAELQEELKPLQEEERKVLALLATSNDDHAWFFEGQLEQIDEAKAKIQAAIKRWDFKKHALYTKHASKGLDLDAIKLIPCEQFLPPAVHKNHATSHFKAPWRNEKSPSLVVYHKQNRWWDFGENIGGTVIDMVMKLEDCDFKEAIKYLSK